MTTPTPLEQLDSARAALAAQLDADAQQHAADVAQHDQDAATIADLQAQLAAAKAPNATGGDTGSGGTTTPPPSTESADGTRVAAASDPPIVDAAGHTWSLNASAQVVRDGSPDTNTNHVDALLYKGGTVYQTAWSEWYAWNGTQWSKVPDPTATTSSGSGSTGSTGSGSTGGSTGTGSSSAGPASYLGGSWVSDPSRTVDFTKPGAQVPDWMLNARYIGNTLDWDWNRQTANSQEDVRQAVVRDGALRLGIAVADDIALANVEAGASWKYVVGCASGKPGCFIENGDVWEIDCYAPPEQWARGRWDGISIYGVDDNGNEVWIFELDVMEIDNAWGGPSQPNITNPTENWHAGTKQASEYQSGSASYDPPGDWTKPATYQVVREGDAFQVYCNGIPHGAKRQMTPAQAALHAYAVVGCSVRQGYDSMPTGDGVVITRWETFKKA